MRVPAANRGETKGGEMVVTPDPYKRPLASAPRELHRVPLVH
jgi:hypothetical protein